MGPRPSALTTLFTALAITCGATADQRVGLFIGVGKYDKPGFAEVPGAVNDAQALAVEFTRLGFETHTMTDAPGVDCATRDRIRSKFAEMIAPLGKNDVLVLGLAGHGQQLETAESGGSP